MLAAVLDTLVGSLFIVICILLILVVLLQKGRGGGLSAAFGGAGSSAFGTRVGDVLTWVTIVMVVLFLLLAMGVTLLYKPTDTAAPMPKLSPPDKTAISKETKVTIVYGIKDAKFYYTIGEDTEPDEKSERYEGSITVKPGQTLKVRAYVKGFAPSKVATAKYRRTVATSAPAVSLPVAPPPVTPKPAEPKPAEPKPAEPKPAEPAPATP